MAETVFYGGKRYTVIPDIDDAIEEFLARKAKGETDLAIVDASVYSDKTGYIIVESKEPGRL